MESVLAPGSLVRSFGGLKGQPAAADMEKTILRFTGATMLGNGYGMTELTTGFSGCRHGRFHVPPWIVPFVLDTTTGAPLPRTGVQKGRAAFLAVQTYWGGVVSADRVTLDWSNCQCGRTTPHIHPDVSRIPVEAEDDHAIGSASPDAIHAALMALDL
jgi:hypothetical protein